MRIKILLNCKKPQQKYIHVRYEVQLSQIELDRLGGEILLNFPSWTPGSYLMREHASLLSLFRAETSNGTKLKFQKTHKNQWKIKT